MENEILTGRKLNEAKKNTTNEAVEEILRSAQEQLNRDMNALNRQENKVEDKAALEKKAREKEQRERLVKDQEERIRKAQQKKKEQKDKEKKADREKNKKEQEQKAAQERARREQEQKEAQERIKKEQEQKAAQERARREQEQKEAQERIRKEQEQKAAQERARREQEQKEAQERIKKEQELKAAQERARKEQEQKEAQERIKKEEEQKAAQEKAKIEQESRAAQEKAERERFVKEQAEKERVGKELAAYDKNADSKNQNVDNDKNNTNDQVIQVQGNTQRIDIQVVDGLANKTADEKKAVKEIAATKDIADDVFVETNVPTPIRRKEGITVGDVIGGFVEFIWTMFKLAVVVSIVTAIVGFFLSREMLIRGRNGNLRCLENMPVSQVVADNIDASKSEIKDWIRNVKYQKLSLESDDGYILIARKMVINKDSNDWAVVLHGYNGNMEDVYDIAKKYASKGYNILVPDLRASGESEGSFIGMGWLDRLDVINWIDVILDDYPDANVVIHGVDMGADTALMISGEPIKSNIKVIITDSAYTSAWDVMKKEFKKRHEDWPEFPLMEMVNPVAKVWGGYSLREADAVKQVEKASVPILLIQGGADTYVTADMAGRLNEAVASTHKLVTIPTGTHGDCRYADPETYYGEVFGFVELHNN